MNDPVVVASAITGLSAVLVALVSRPSRKRLKAIDERTERELEHNHGSSMKDDVYGLAISIGELQRGRDEDRARVDTLLGIAAVHHPDFAPMYLALRSNHDE